LSIINGASTIQQGKKIKRINILSLKKMFIGCEIRWRIQKDIWKNTTLSKE